MYELVAVLVSLSQDSFLSVCIFFFSSRSRHTRCALVTGVQTCALPISAPYGDGYSFTTSNEWVQMQTGGEHVGACLQRHLEAGERCAGAGLAAAQVLAAKERGVEMRTSTEVIELVIEDGQVLGVVARDGAGTKRIRARLGVVLARTD